MLWAIAEHDTRASSYWVEGSRGGHEGISVRGISVHGLMVEVQCCGFYMRIKHAKLRIVAHAYDARVSVCDLRLMCSVTCMLSVANCC